MSTIRTNVGARGRQARISCLEIGGRDENSVTNPRRHVALEQKRKAGKKPFGNFPASPEVQGLPEEGGAGHNRVVVDSLTDLVFGRGGDELGL